MIPPLVAARNLAAALLFGCVLGVLYSFLRPLRPRFLADGLFLCGLFSLWTYLGFGVWGGDLRFGYTAGLFLGALLWHRLFGAVLTGLFSLFWQGLTRPVRGILKKFIKKRKFLFPRAKK